MCEKWKFGCGHSAETHCQAYKNRILTETDEEGTGGTGDDDNDPFTDTGAHRSNNAKDRLARARSKSTPTSPPRFVLPSSTESSVTSDTDASSSSTSSLRRRRRSSITRSYGPGPAVRNTGSSATPRLSVAPAAEKIKVCGGPGRNKKRTDDACYDCILRNAKDDRAFQQNERAAETRLYDEIGRQGNPAGGGADRRDGYNCSIRGNVENGNNPSRIYARGSPAYVNNAIDIGRGNPPPRGPRRGSTARNSNVRGGHHRAPAPAPAPAAASAYYFQPQAPNRFFDPTSYQDSGPLPTTVFHPNNMYQTAGPLAQYAPQNNNQYQQQPQQNPYQLPLDPYGGGGGAPSPYQQYLYPQMEMQPPPPYQGEGSYDAFQYAGMQQQQQAGYSYFQGGM
jgi:hypothetical protein